MERRAFIGGLVGSALVLPRRVRAQVPSVPTVGFLNGQSAEPLEHLTAAFRTGLSERGYVDGDTVTIDYRWANNEGSAVLRVLAADLAIEAAVIFAGGGNTAIAAAQEHAPEIPVVFVTGSDPVEAGFAESLTRPVDNLTGITFFAVVLEQKRLELLHKLLPSVTTVSVLVQSSQGFEPVRAEVEHAAAVLGLGLRIFGANSAAEIDSAFAAMTQDRPQALLIAGNGFYLSRREQIVAGATGLGVPTVYTQREFVTAGGLMSYGTSLASAYRRAGIYVGQILDGADTRDLPVVQDTLFEFVINLRTAAALGVTIPTELMIAATEFIE